MTRLPLIAVIGAGALSRFAEGLGGVALIWLVLQMDKGAAPVGYLAAFSLGAVVISSAFGGALVDRFGARRIAVIGTVLSALPLAVLIGFATVGALSLLLLFALVLAAQLPDGATGAAFEARLPELAERAGLPLERVNAVDDLVDGVAGIAGAPAAGFIILHAGVVPALWTAFAIGILAALVAALFLPDDKSRDRTGGVLYGFRFIFAHRDLLLVIGAAAILIAAFQSLEDVVLPVLIDAAGRGPDALGIVIGCAGLGAAAGALLFMAFSHRLGPRRVFFGAVALIGAAFLAIAVSPSWNVFLTAAIGAGFGAGALGPLVSTMLQRAAPLASRGRVLGAAAALALSLSPLTAAVSGVLIDSVGARGVLAGFACLITVTAMVGATRPGFLRPVTCGSA